MSIKCEKIGGQKRKEKEKEGTLERGYFAGEKNKRSVASSELRVWGKTSALWLF